MGKKATLKLLQKAKKRQNVSGNSKKQSSDSHNKKVKGGLIRKITGEGQKKNRNKSNRKRKSNDFEIVRNGEKEDEEDDFEMQTSKEHKLQLESKNKAKLAIKSLKSNAMEDMIAGGSDDNDDDDDEEEEEDMDEEENEQSEEAEDGEEDMEEDDDGDDEEQHKKDLELLKERDPEFYQHLQEEGQDLLQFGEEEEEEEEEIDEDGNKKKKGKSISSKFIQQAAKNALEPKNKSGLRILVQIFRAACWTTDPDHSADTSESKYFIPSSIIYQETMVLCLSTIHQALRVRLWPKGNTKEQQVLLLKAPNTSPHWKLYEAQVKLFLASLVRLLELANDVSMQEYILEATKNYVPYMALYPDVHGKKFLRKLVEIWSESNEKKIQISAFLRMRQLSITKPDPFLESSIRGTYMSFIRGAKFSSPHVAEKLALQARCIVELAGLDMSTSYQLAFFFIRKLALVLHDAITAHTIEAMQAVYCWQFIHSLRVWGAVLCAYPGNASDPTPSTTSLRELIYPLVQIVFGVINLVPTIRNFPLRLHCVDLLVKLGRSSNVYIPVLGAIIPILRSKELFGKKPIPSTMKPPEFAFTLRSKKNQIGTVQHLDMIVFQTLSSIHEYLAFYRHSVALPEIAFSIASALRLFIRESRVPKWRTSAMNLLKQIESWSLTVVKDRATANFGPRNIQAVEEFANVGRNLTAANNENEKEEIFKVFGESKAKNATTSSNNSKEEQDDDDDDDHDDFDKKNEEEEEEDDDENEANSKKSRKQKKQKISNNKNKDDDNDDHEKEEEERLSGDEDVVNDLDWSDLEDEED